MVILLLLITIVACTAPQPEKISCTELRNDFDIYIKNRNLSIQNASSLCFDINVATNYSITPAKWAVATLLKIDKENKSLQFQGNEQIGDIPVAQSDNLHYQVGEDYKVDMNNICRQILSWADSRYPSPIEKTFVKPERVECVE